MLPARPRTGRCAPDAAAPRGLRRHPLPLRASAPGLNSEREAPAPPGQGPRPGHSQTAGPDSRFPPSKVNRKMGPAAVTSV